MTDKFNAEGYYDPVTYEALNRIEKEERAARKAASFKPVVYVCSPYSGDIDRNIANARMYSRFAVAKNRKFVIRCFISPLKVVDEVKYKVKEEKNYIQSLF